MIDRANAEAATFRVGVAALTYRADKAATEPGYTIDEDVDWCIQPLRGIEPETFERLRHLVQETIVDPTSHRVAFNSALADLVAPEEATP
ncbi:hypothetical protein [Microbacterium sp.]|uniref:hypothetical protein n=1 Tax=Microbacterium sp. TaxID=51671 RepID=UPI003F72506A